MKYICIFSHFSTLKWHRLLKSFLVQHNNPFIMLIQIPDEVRSQGISSHKMKLVLLEYSSFSMLRVKRISFPPSTLNLSSDMKFQELRGKITIAQVHRKHLHWTGFLIINKSCSWLLKSQYVKMKAIINKNTFSDLPEFHGVYFIDINDKW